MSADPILTRELNDPATPTPAKGRATSLVASATLAASGAYAHSDPIDLEGARRLVLLVSYSPNAVGGYPGIIPAFGYTIVEGGPAATDDVWYVPAVWDGSVTATLLTAASQPAGTDYTVQPEFGFTTHRPMLIRLEAGDAATDEIRIAVTLEVGAARWARVSYAELGVVATPGTLAISYSLGT